MSAENKNSSESQNSKVDGYHPDALAKKLQGIVLQDGRRKYYRLARAGKWYGGIATADCCGCNLRCAFCWSATPRDNVQTIGSFYEPFEVARALIATARKHHYGLARISGNEPTLGKNHLLRVIHEVEVAGLAFILETNGLLIDLPLAKALSAYSNLHVRVSLKGTDPAEFHRLTGAHPESFGRQLKALENLLVSGVSCHPAAMTTFSAPEKVSRLRDTLRIISPDLESDLEEETIILYPRVREQLRHAGLEPREAHRP